MSDKASDLPLLSYNNRAPAVQHSATSGAAADSIEPHISAMQARILDYLAWSGGSTDEELQDGLKLAQSTERPRRRELELAGRVRDSGATRKTKSGRSAVVWIVL